MTPELLNEIGRSLGVLQKHNAKAIWMQALYDEVLRLDAALHNQTQRAEWAEHVKRENPFRVAARARSAALEEAAKVAEACLCAVINPDWEAAQEAIAADIRALANSPSPASTTHPPAAPGSEDGGL